jgi:hypothetical protein
MSLSGRITGRKLANKPPAERKCFLCRCWWEQVITVSHRRSQRLCEGIEGSASCHGQYSLWNGNTRITDQQPLKGYAQSFTILVVIRNASKAASMLSVTNGIVTKGWECLHGTLNASDASDMPHFKSACEARKYTCISYTYIGLPQVPQMFYKY